MCKCTKCGGRVLTFGGFGENEIVAEVSDSEVQHSDYLGSIVDCSAVMDEDGDFLIAICMACGQVQGEFPMQLTEHAEKVFAGEVFPDDE